MKQIYLSLIFLFSFYQQAASQKVVLLQSYADTDPGEYYLFAGHKFYLEQDVNYSGHINIYDFETRRNIKSQRFGIENLYPNRTMGALGNSLMYFHFSTALPSLYLLHPDSSEALLREIQYVSEIRATDDFTILSYGKKIDQTNSWKRVARIDNKTREVKTIFETDKAASISIEYVKSKGLFVFAVHHLAPKNIEIYVTNGYESDVKLIGSFPNNNTYYLRYTDLINNGNELYYVQSFDKTNPLGSFRRDFVNIHKIDLDNLTVKDLGLSNKFFFWEIPYVENEIIYGNDAQVGELLKIENGITTTLLKTDDATFYKGKFNSKYLFNSNGNLYETDGTAAGTTLITDQVHIGSSEIGKQAHGMYNKSTIEFNGNLYFFKNDEEHGNELWKYDGDSVSLVADIIPGKEGLRLTNFYKHENELYFVGREMYDPVTYRSTLNLYKLEESSSTLTLNSYADYNSNQVKDDEEPFLQNVKYLLNAGQITLYPGKETNSIPLSNGDYTIKAVPKPGWTSVKTDQDTTINLPQQNGARLAFGFKPDTVYTKVDASVMSEATRCSFSTPFRIYYYNSGFTNANGTIKLVPDNAFIYESAVPAPDQILGDTLVWIVNLLKIDQKGVITVNYKMPGVDQIGDTLNSVLITNFASDDLNYTYQNSSSLNQILTCSYDPNDIQANPVGEGAKHFTLKNKPIEYLIRFQNMGTDKAFNIVVKNEIQEELDLNTLQVIGSSHAMYTRLKGRQLSFHFDNIQIPDDKTNEPGSHGYILYSIKPKQNLQDSTIVNNKASIFFDYNPSIETNTTFNTLVDKLPTKLVLSTDDVIDQFAPLIYPNPTDNFINIELPTSGNYASHFSIINSKGLKVIDGKFEHTKKYTIDISSWQPGLYFVKVNTIGKIYAYKIIII